MQALLDGIRHYESEVRRGYEQTFAALASSQTPHTLFLGCADSRVVPSLLTASEPGDLFIVRNVANIAPPHSHGAATGVLAAVNYAVDVLGVRDIVVCGHSGCGGMRALLEGNVADPGIAGWLESARPALDRWREAGPMNPSLAPVDQLSQQSARFQLETLAEYPSVQKALRKNRVRLHAFWFHIPDGRMLAYSARDGVYKPAVEVLEEKAAESRAA